MPSLSQRVRSARRDDATPALVLWIVCSGVVLASLDLFIVNVALPDMGADLGAGGLGDLSWVLNGYAIVYASLLVLFGRLADRHRRERGFLLGVAVFTAASAACGLATSVTMLVAFRLVQAAGAALLTPTSLGLVLATAAPERRASSVRAWTAVGGLAAALGPVVGGLLVAASWRWVFLVNVPIGLAALVVGWRRLPAGARPSHPAARRRRRAARDRRRRRAHAGAGQGRRVGLGLGRDGRRAGVRRRGARGVRRRAACAIPTRWWTPRCSACGPSPARRSWRWCSRVAFGAMLLSIVLWEQDVWGWSALRTGLAIAPGPLMVPLFSFLVAGRLIARFGPGR